MTTSATSFSAWRTETVRVKDIGIDEKRFQAREGPLPEDRLAAMEDAGRACCGQAFCLHRYEPVELWEHAPRGVADDRSLFLLAGHHRVQLAWRNDVRTLEARVAVGWSEQAAVAYAARSNVRTRAYAPLEEAAVFRALAESGKTWEQVSAELDGKRPEYYRRRADLTYLTDALKAALRDGTLRPEYAEVIGGAARRGLGPVGQQYLRDLARTSGKRIEVFRAVVERLVAEAAPQSTQGLLFDLPADEVVARVEAAMAATTEQLRQRGAWQKLVVAGQQVLKFDAAQTPEVVRAVDLGRLRVTSLEKALGIDPTLVVEDAPDLAVVASPVLKWAGGKRWLLPTLLPILRDALRRGTNRLVEPFAGGAAATLALGPRSGLLADALPDLMQVYTEAREASRALYEHLEILKAEGTDELTYYQIRALEDLDAVSAAARTVYLNKVGYNGLYRTNRAGKFNVPHGNPSPSWPTLADLEAVARALEGVEVWCCDWREALADAQPGDVVYADPPYFGTYDGYGPKWDEAEHEALAGALRAKLEEGVSVVATQPDCPEARRWYAWCALTPVVRAKGYAVGGRKSRRAARGELVCVAKPLELFFGGRR